MRTPMPMTSKTLIPGRLVRVRRGAPERGDGGGVVPVRRLRTLGEHRDTLAGDGEESSGYVVGDLVAPGSLDPHPARLLELAQQRCVTGQHGEFTLRRPGHDHVRLA